MSDLDSEVELEKQQKKQAGKWLREASKDAKKWVYATVGIGFLSGLLLILQMYWLAHIAYGAYMQSMSAKMMWGYFAGIGVIFIVRAGLAWLREVISFKTSAMVRSRVRQALLDHINRIGPVAAGKYSTGELVSSVMEQVEGLHNFLVSYLPQMSLAVFIPLAILVFVFPVSIVCAIVFIICAPLIPLFMALVGMGAASLHQQHFRSLARMSHHFLDVMQGLVTLKVFGRGQSQAQQIFEISDGYRQRTMSVLRIAFLSSAVLELFAAASIALIAIYLGLGFLNHGMQDHMWWSISGMTLQGALFILLLAPEFFLPLRELGTHYHAKAEAVGSAIEIQKIFALKPMHCDDESTKQTWVSSDQVELSFESLSVDYERGVVKALNDLNLTIKKGEKVAIVGPSGAGKTTLLNTVLGFVSASEGYLKANGQDISQLDQRSWYQAVSWVGQNPNLFKGTIRENLMMANAEASEGSLKDEIKRAGLESFIQSLPKGLDTEIGERNSGVSGGQAQRIALARMYLKNAPLLLLDEPTASLDADYEDEIIQGLVSFWCDKTALVLTHRFALLKHVDRIIVLDEGRCVQIGDFETLMQDQEGLMYQLFQAKGAQR